MPFSVHDVKWSFRLMWSRGFNCTSASVFAFYPSNKVSKINAWINAHIVGVSHMTHIWIDILQIIVTRYLSLMFYVKIYIIALQSVTLFYKEGNPRNAIAYNSMFHFHAWVKCSCYESMMSRTRITNRVLCNAVTHLILSHTWFWRRTYLMSLEAKYKIHNLLRFN